VEPAHLGRYLYARLSPVIEFCCIDAGADRRAGRDFARAHHDRELLLGRGLHLRGGSENNNFVSAKAKPATTSKPESTA